MSAVSVRAGEPGASLPAGPDDDIGAGCATDARAGDSVSTALGLVRSTAHPAAIVTTSATAASAPAEKPFIDASYEGGRLDGAWWHRQVRLGP